MINPTNSIFESTVRSMTSEGMGVVEGPEGKVFFVPAVWVGDQGSFKIIESKKNYGRAILVELRAPSASRMKAPCPHFGWTEGSCGGCQWQFVDYESQLKAKQDRVEYSLKRLELGEKVVQKIWPSEKVFGYRNRAQFKTDGQKIGFVSHSSRSLAPIEDCLILSDKNRGALNQLKASLPFDSWKNLRAEWNTIDVDEDLADEWAHSFDRNRVILNQRRPFRQANSDQNLRMKKWLFEKLAALDKSYSVLELFAGSGNFTEVILEAGFEKVGAAEVVEEALTSLRNKNFKNLKLMAADLFVESSFHRVKSLFPAADVLVMDPPRDGLKEKKGIWNSYPELKYVGYVSCDVATFARDLKDFMEQGFRVVEIQPLDQFPHTPHVEILSWLERS